MGLFDSIKKIASNGGKGHTIDDFKAIVGKRAGLARQNRFVVIMSPPTTSLFNTDIQGLIGSALSGNLGLNDFINDPRDIALLCDSSSIPGRQLNTIEYERDMYRNQVKIPYTYTNEDVSMNFHLTNDYYARKFFEKWMASVFNRESHTLNYQKTYTTDITIQQLDQDNVVVYGVKLKDAYPTSINSIPFDNSASDTTQKLSVTFTFSEFEPQGAVDSIVSGAKGLLGGIKKLF
jgi:hypothetical protein